MRSLMAHRIANSRSALQDRQAKQLADVIAFSEVALTPSARGVWATKCLELMAPVGVVDAASFTAADVTLAHLEAMQAGAKSLLSLMANVGAGLRMFQGRWMVLVSDPGLPEIRFAVHWMSAWSKGDATIGIRGSALDVFLFAVLELLRNASARRLIRRCRCQRLFVREGRKENCSTRCQMRYHMREVRQRERNERRSPRRKVR